MTNVRWSHDDCSLISLGGADTSLMVWKYSGGSHDQASDQSQGSLPTSMYLSEDSDTDSEEEGKNEKNNFFEIIFCIQIII